MQLGWGCEGLFCVADRVFVKVTQKLSQVPEKCEFSDYVIELYNFLLIMVK